MLTVSGPSSYIELSKDAIGVENAPEDGRIRTSRVIAINKVSFVWALIIGYHPVAG
jgi:hypothetical protein